jgi:hypothetical protein
MERMPRAHICTLTLLALFALAGCGGESTEGDDNGAPIPKRTFTPLTPEQREAAEYEQRAQTGEGEPATDSASRKALVAQIEKSILADARQREKDKELTGEGVKRVVCKPSPRYPDLVLQCTAVTQDIQQSEAGKEEIREGIIGHPFTAKVDYAKGTYAWCKRDLSPGEGGLIDPRTQVELPPECRTPPAGA